MSALPLEPAHLRGEPTGADCKLSPCSWGPRSSSPCVKGPRELGEDSAPGRPSPASWVRGGPGAASLSTGQDPAEELVLHVFKHKLNLTWTNGTIFQISHYKQRGNKHLCTHMLV